MEFAFAPERETVRKSVRELPEEPGKGKHP